MRSSSSRSSAAGPANTTRPPESTTTRSASLRMTCEVLLDEQDRHGLRGLGERVGDLVDDARGEALGRLVDEEEPVLVHEGPGEGDHLLLSSGERACALGAAFEEIGEEPLDELSTRVVVALGEPQVLGDGERAEDLAVFGHVADALLHDAVGRQSGRCACRRGAPRRFAG